MVISRRGSGTGARSGVKADPSQSDILIQNEKSLPHFMIQGSDTGAGSGVKADHSQSDILIQNEKGVPHPTHSHAFRQTNHVVNPDNF